MRRQSAIPPSGLWLFLLGVILALFGTHAGRNWDFTVDDAGISFAYARHLANGFGLVLTPGSERVEAATNLLWCLALVPAKWLGMEHEFLAKVLGLAGACGALIGIAWFPSTAYQRKPGYYDLVAPLIAACMPHFVIWSVSGLENGMFSGLAAAALVAVAHEENHPKRFPWSAVLLVLLFGTRPDGILYAAAIGCAKLLRQITPRTPRQDIVWVAALALGIGGIELFRLAYFAWPFPNSFYSKKRTFDFGKDLFATTNLGWGYVGRFLQDYKFTRVIYAVPLMLVGARAPVARIAAFGFICAAFFFPIYSHGDWMEEYRFLSFGVPFIALGFTEAGRAAVRLIQVFLPRSLRVPVALFLTPLMAYGVLKEATQHYPERLLRTARHETLEFKHVRGRARYFVAAARRLDIDAMPSLLDPDVGGSSYDGRLRIIDLFGLGDISIAHTHPVDPPGSREAIFWERRPTFIHLHGAWFGAMELHRLEEIEQGYLHLPGRLADGETDPDSNYVRRETIAAPWYLPAELHPPEGVTRTGLHPDAFTVSHTAIEPGHRMMVEFTYANAEAHSGGTVSLVPADPRARTVDVNLQFAGGLLDGSNFIAGERPRARAWFAPAAGRYTVLWRGSGGQAGMLGTLNAQRGAGELESRTLRDTMDRELRAGHFGAALRLARRLGLRVVADPRDALAMEALGHYGAALASRAAVMAAEGGAYTTAALAAREARAWAGHDATTVSRVQAVGERLADAGRVAERRRDLAAAFILSREAVLTDPRRSWARRRVEELRPSRVGEYDGARDQWAYRFAAAVVAGTYDLDRAVLFMGSTERWIEAAAIAERTGRTPTDPHARVIVARGLISRGEATEALALVSGIPCASAHDPELTRALRAVLGRPYRAGDTACDAPLPAPAAPFDNGEGSFESGTFRGWMATGTAFGARPNHSRSEHEQFINGWRGWYFANSYSQNTDEAAGVLRSRPFVVRGEGISFLIGGGSDTSHVGIRLMIDGQAVTASGGNNTEALKRGYWNVTQWAGRTATIEIFDTGGGGWGHVLADDFRIEPMLPPGSQPPAAADE